MNVYDNFFMGISPESWEFFAIDFLGSLGFYILQYPSRGPDGGSDAIVEYEGKRYIVSAKHFVRSGKSVGVSDEQSILDRIFQYKAQGFIGFYSTLPSTSLLSRFNELSQRGYLCLYYDKNIISNFIPKISSQIMQKYGLPNQVQFVLNVPEYSYSQLNCLGCGVDILSESMIRISMALVIVDGNNKLEYLYGCKKCLCNFLDLGWVCVYQAIHQEELNGWRGYVDEILNEYEPSPNFYKNRSEFEGKILQRTFPSNWGAWLQI